METNRSILTKNRDAIRRLSYSCIFMQFLSKFFPIFGGGGRVCIFLKIWGGGGDTKINSKIPQNQNRPKWNSDIVTMRANFQNPVIQLEW